MAVKPWRGSSGSAVIMMKGMEAPRKSGKANGVSNSSSSEAWGAGPRHASYTRLACGKWLSRIQARKKCRKRGVIA